MKARMKLENRSKHNEQTCRVSHLFNKVPGNLMNVDLQPFFVFTVVKVTATKATKHLHDEVCHAS